MTTARLLMDRRVKERLIGATILVALIVLIVPELLSGPKQAPVLPLTAAPPTTQRRSIVVNLATSKATPEAQAADAASASVEPRGAPGAGAAHAAGPSAGGSPLGGAASRDPSAGASAPGDSAARVDAPAASSEAASAGASQAPTVTLLKAQPPSALEAERPGAPLETSSFSPRSAENGTAAGSGSLRGHRGWAVQLGSFASKANAQKLLRQLPGGGFYLVSSGSGRSLRYRVRMGPLADRSAAERAMAKLKAEGHSATIVTPNS